MQIVFAAVVYWDNFMPSDGMTVRSSFAERTEGKGLSQVDANLRQPLLFVFGFFFLVYAV